jgi:hypothetical protein
MTSRSLIGTELDQIPVNAMLGGLAYQSPENATIKNLDLRHISEINAEVASTAVDVFVYDTSKDSDGGAWRYRTQHTSWYNETLNTPTRGSRQEFPAVAVIVAESTQLTIYDGDDPDLPMWMVFNLLGAVGSNSNMIPIGGSGSESDITSIACLNGRLAVGLKDVNGNVGEGLAVIDFISELARIHRGSASGYTGAIYGVPISGRNSNNVYSGDYDSLAVVHETINDVAMTVLPNAPIDSATGLPIPTIAVATDGGASIIKDDGSVVDWTETSGPDSTYKLSFRKDGKLGVFTSGTAGAGGYPQLYYIDIPSTDISSTYYYAFASNNFEMYGGTAWETNTAGNLVMRNAVGSNPLTQNLTDVVDAPNLTYAATNAGLNAIIKPEVFGTPNAGEADMRTGAIAYIQNDYNTGYMFGDIKGAFLSDTTAESLTANTNLATNATQFNTGRLASETYDDGDTSWQMVDNAATANGYLNLRLNGLTTGQSYIISVTFDNNATLDAGYDHRIDDNIGGTTSFTHWNKTNASSETLTGVFTATSQNGEEFVCYANGITLNVSNFIVRAVDDEDRSVNNKGLQVFGTVTKSAVATGADLVAYSGFSASNYLQQPYNSDFLFGSDDFCITGWVNNTSPSSSVYEDILNFGNHGVVGYAAMEPGTWFIQLNKNYGYNMYFRTTSGIQSSGWSNYTASGNFQKYSLNGIGIWYKITIVRIGDQIYSYVNDDLLGSVNFAGNLTTSSNLSDMKLTYGYEGGNSYGPYVAQYSKMALWRISRSAPSAEQIKKIYEDERVLFQENAKCTLYGTSDAVTALAYDDSASLLHVGTSSGRSEFKGLRRVGNTTTAVTTAISASNGLVAEQ